MRTKTVRVEWERLHWQSRYVWNSDMLPQLQKLTAQDLTTCVYVISVTGVFAVRYPEAVSPTLYIGRGNLRDRIKRHGKWMDKLTDLVSDYSFRIDVCRPRTYSGLSVCKDMEATLIHKFFDMYGSIPIHNKRKEYPNGEFNYTPMSELKKPLMKGQGSRYKWAIEPLSSNSYHKKFMASQKIHGFL